MSHTNISNPRYYFVLNVNVRRCEPYQETRQGDYVAMDGLRLNGYRVCSRSGPYTSGENMRFKLAIESLSLDKQAALDAPPRSLWATS